MNTRSHSAGAGLGAVFGVKNLKAVVIRGTKAVHVADPQMVADLSDYMIAQVIGSNNNHVVPSTQQSWLSTTTPVPVGPPRRAFIGLPPKVVPSRLASPSRLSPTPWDTAA